MEIDETIRIIECIDSNIKVNVSGIEKLCSKFLNHMPNVTTIISSNEQFSQSYISSISMSESLANHHSLCESKIHPGIFLNIKKCIESGSLLIRLFMYVNNDSGMNAKTIAQEPDKNNTYDPAHDLMTKKLFSLASLLSDSIVLNICSQDTVRNPLTHTNVKALINRLNEKYTDVGYCKLSNSDILNLEYSKDTTLDEINDVTYNIIDKKHGDRLVNGIHMNDIHMDDKVLDSILETTLNSICTDNNDNLSVQNSEHRYDEIEDKQLYSIDLTKVQDMMCGIDDFNASNEKKINNIFQKLDAKQSSSNNSNKFNVEEWIRFLRIIVIEMNTNINSILNNATVGAAYERVVGLSKCDNELKDLENWSKGLKLSDKDEKAIIRSIEHKAYTNKDFLSNPHESIVLKYRLGVENIKQRQVLMRRYMTNNKIGSYIQFVTISLMLYCIRCVYTLINCYVDIEIITNTFYQIYCAMYWIFIATLVLFYMAKRLTFAQLHSSRPVYQSYRNV